MKAKGEKLFCLLGNPISHSLSPIMHRAAFQAMGLAACYHAFLVRDLEGAIRGIRAFGILGASVTIPFKERVIHYLDELDNDAYQIGAVNTLLNLEGKLIGFNTDARGFMQALRKVEDPRRKRVVLLGAGGAARAAAYALTAQGAQVIILNRNLERAKKLAQDFSCSFIPWEERENVAADILVNTTPVGMFPQTDASPFPLERLNQFELVMDIVYNPEETMLIKGAKGMGIRTIGGVEMFVQQGAEQIRIWTGLEPPIEVMRRAVQEAILHES